MANKTLARALRKRQTDAERLLWYSLRGRRFAGYKFRRQEVIGNYVVDFVCFDPKLIVELDGGQHAEQVAYDNRRTEYLSGLGYVALRFWNNDMLKQSDGVLEAILAGLRTSPLPQGEGQGEGSKHTT